MNEHAIAAIKWCGMIVGLIGVVVLIALGAVSTEAALALLAGVGAIFGVGQVVQRRAAAHRDQTGPPRYP